MTIRKIRPVYHCSHGLMWQILPLKEVDAGGEIYTNITFGYINDKYTQAYAAANKFKDYSGDVVTDSRVLMSPASPRYSSEPGR